MSVATIIDELGGTTAVAVAIGVDAPVVSNWRRRGRIPSDWWPALVEFARRKDLSGITFDRLASVQLPRRETEGARA
jgi:hypothetical protein